MKGVILAGGTGSRLMPLTKITNKHLLPIYDKPMIYYPLKTLIDAGLNEILIVTGPGHAGDFLNLLGSGREFGVKLTYEIQDEPGGIAQALGMAENFADDQPIMVILGDNIFEDNFKTEAENFESGAKIFLKELENANRFGVATLDGNRIIGIEEKPTVLKSNFAVSGLYIYDSEVFNIIKKLKPSKRGEIEITDVNNNYINRGKMKISFVKGFWGDAGTLESMVKSINYIHEKESGSIV